MSVTGLMRRQPVKGQMAPQPEESQPKRQPVEGGMRRRRGPWLLMIPALVVMAIGFAVPLIIMVARSLNDPSPKNYSDFFSSALNVHALWYTLWMALLVTVIALVIGYPYAYLLTAVKSRVIKAILTFVVLLPFWTSLLVRTYAWSILLQDNGMINRVLLGLHLVSQPIALAGTSRGVIIGMVQILLPYMVLVLYANMRRIPADLMPAARSLGASRTRAFTHVFLPLSRPGIAAGSMLVFILGIGFYITPAVLGGRTVFFSLIIDSQVENLLNFGYASAMAVIMLVVITALVVLFRRLVRDQDVTF
jgi:putative spermidine/putrescine transport system permease protein